MQQENTTAASQHMLEDKICLIAFMGGKQLAQGITQTIDVQHEKF